jgi:hypothetical protein
MHYGTLAVSGMLLCPCCLTTRLQPAFFNSGGGPLPDVGPHSVGGHRALPSAHLASCCGVHAERTQEGPRQPPDSRGAAAASLDCSGGPTAASAAGGRRAWHCCGSWQGGAGQVVAVTADEALQARRGAARASQPPHQAIASSAAVGLSVARRGGALDRSPTAQLGLIVRVVRVAVCECSEVTQSHNAQGRLLE